MTFFENDWHEGSAPIMGLRTHAAWLCTSVFDGGKVVRITGIDERNCGPAPIYRRARELYWELAHTTP
jgi:hypothetical protein